VEHARLDPAVTVAINVRCLGDVDLAVCTAQHVDGRAR
jgi:hypothetical protein